MKWVDYAVLIAITFFVALLMVQLVPIYGFTQGQDWDVMCAITNIEPYYDCKEKWILTWKDSGSIKTPTNSWVSGFAVHGMDGISATSTLNICNFHPQVNQTNPDYCSYQWMGIALKPTSDACYGGPTFCMTILAHEIRHMKCDCNWHKQLNPTKTFTIFI